MPPTIFQGTPVLNLPSSSSSGSPYLVVRTAVEILDLTQDETEETLDYVDPGPSSASTSFAAAWGTTPCTLPPPSSTSTIHLSFYEFNARAPTTVGSVVPSSSSSSTHPLTTFHPSSIPSLASPSSLQSFASSLSSFSSSSSSSPSAPTTTRLSETIPKAQPRGGNVAMVSGAIVAAITVLSAVTVSIVILYGCHRRARNRSLGMGLGSGLVSNLGSGAGRSGGSGGAGVIEDELRRSGFQASSNYDRRRNHYLERDGAVGGVSGTASRGTGGTGIGRGESRSVNGWSAQERGEGAEVRLADVRSDGGKSDVPSQRVGPTSPVKRDSR